VKEFHELCSPSSERFNPAISTESYKCIELEHLSQETGRLLGYSPSNDLKSMKTKFQKNDILFGKLRPYLKKYLFAEFDGVCSTEIWVLKVKEYIDNKWLYYLVQSKRIIDAANQSSGTKMPRADWKVVGNAPVPVPLNKSEQTAIATTLSDTDALIENLEKLIEKKRNIKQGVMQELMKPKSNWENRMLKDVCWFQEGPGVRNYQFKDTGVKLLNGSNIVMGKLNLDNTTRHISNDEAFGIYSHFLANAGDIIIACSGITVDRFHEKVTFVHSEHLPLCMNTSTMRFKITSKDLSTYYLFYFLKSQYFKEQISGQITGSAQLNFGPSHVKRVTILLPDVTEQESITSTLNIMDNEITALENAHYKYRIIKRGMMQVLLTGKSRLI
jgi:type I restriction enzyme S subunit